MPTAIALHSEKGGQGGFALRPKRANPPQSPFSKGGRQPASIPLFGPRLTGVLFNPRSAGALYGLRLTGQPPIQIMCSLGVTIEFLPLKKAKDRQRRSRLGGICLEVQRAKILFSPRLAGALNTDRLRRSFAFSKGGRQPKLASQTQTHKASDSTAAKLKAHAAQPCLQSVTNLIVLQKKHRTL
jgi:hypothetical protein